MDREGLPFIMLTVIKSRRGSITVETTLMLSMVIMILVGLLFSFLVLYQKSLLIKTASMAAQQGAEIWVDSRKEIGNGEWDSQEKRDPLYYRLFEDSLGTRKVCSFTLGDMTTPEQKTEEGISGEGLQEKKINRMKGLIKKELTKGILPSASTTVRVEFQNIFQRRITVSLEQKIKIPLGFLAGFLGQEGSLVLSAKEAAIVSEPAENIRNIDLAIEYSKKMTEKMNFNGIWEKLKDKSSY